MTVDVITGRAWNFPHTHRQEISFQKVYQSENCGHHFSLSLNLPPPLTNNAQQPNPIRNVGTQGARKVVLLCCAELHSSTDDFFRRYRPFLLTQ